ncbi:MAG: ABC-type transport auxiliary lipoprotein family protein [bacterium]|nr:ABC-type transport auxiliary lipoprotein family protein [bacterium]
MSKRSGYIAAVVSAGAVLTACVALQEPLVHYYGIDTPGGIGGEEKRPLRVAIQRMEGRAQYQRPRMVVSPGDQVVDSFTSAKWVDDPCDMLTDGLVTYLAQRCEYVTVHPRVYKDAVRYVVVAYLDAFDHVRRDGAWYACMRVKFDIVDDETRAVRYSDWFQRMRVLPDGQVRTYVAAQQRSVQEWYGVVLAALEHVSKTSRAAGGQ